MQNFVTKFVMLLTLFVMPSVASAQWTQGITPAQNGGEFWDNTSSDGTNCNIGFVLLGNGANCGAQRPVGILPIDLGDQLLSKDYRATNPGFNLFTNTATIKLFADVAGQNREWGWFTGNTFTSLNSGPSALTADGAGALIGNTVGWGLYIDLVSSGRALSTGNQFAFFAEANGMGGVNTGALRFGAEDINVAQGWGSDRDFNDISGRLDFTGGNLEVPEPATYTLMVAGLFGLGVVSRRRKGNVVTW